MKKLVLTLLSGFLLFGYSQGKTVNEQHARIVATNYLASYSAFSLQGKTTLLELCYAPVEAAGTKSKAEQAPLYYIYNINGSGGFIIISGDDAVIPVLACSSEGKFFPDNIPPPVVSWLEGYGEQISYAINEGLEATEKIRLEWTSLSGVNRPVTDPGSQKGVNPLMTTKWGQGDYYNAFCPIRFYPPPSAFTLTGCVATAMAMVMKYNNWPLRGRGMHQYNPGIYGTRAANFGLNKYFLNSMPDMVISRNDNVARLMYHCGVSVEMNYGVTFSGSQMISAKCPPPGIHCAEYALKTYFGYDQASVRGLEQVNFADTAWSGMLKRELDAGRPVIYGGYNNFPLGGHCFVLDGYQSNIYGVLFHFNWGWDGKYNGDFLIDNMNPDGQGVYTHHEAIIGIKKPAGAKDGGKEFYKLCMNAPISSKSDTISYKDTLSFHTNIINNDQVAFNGDICAVIFDTNDIFIDYVRIIKGISLQPGAQFPSGISFTNPRITKMLPGTYYVGIMYSLGDSVWIGVNDTNSYLNRKHIEVVYKNDIELYSAMNINGGTYILQGSPVSVQLDINNLGLTDLHGTLALTLYDADGDSIKVIDEKTNFTLLSKQHTNGLIFSNPGLNTQPASYQLALRYLPEGTGGWQLTGSGSYENPVEIIVMSAPLTADRYEPNNTQDSAYVLPVSFVSNPAVIITDGANCHTGTDNDFYKITLPGGYTYVLSCILYDAWSDTSHTCTLDGLCSYSSDGTTWSDLPEDTIPSNIVMNNGGTFLLHLCPGFTEEPGTYRLKLSIARNPLGIGETDPHDDIAVYPNPASERLIVKSSDSQGYISGYRMSDIEGREIVKITLPVPVPECVINTAEFNTGFYILRVTTASGLINRKVIIRR